MNCLGCYCDSTNTIILGVHRNKRAESFIRRIIPVFRIEIDN